MKIYVAGHKGLVGSAIIRAIEAEGKHTWIGRTRTELDLLDRRAVFAFLAKEKPDAVVIAATDVDRLAGVRRLALAFRFLSVDRRRRVDDAGADCAVFVGGAWPGRILLFHCDRRAACAGNAPDRAIHVAGRHSSG